MKNPGKFELLLKKKRANIVNLPLQYKLKT